MDRGTERRDGWTRWAYGRNQMDGKDEEGMDGFFSSCSSLLCLIVPFTLFFESDWNSPHSLSVTLSFTFTYYFYFTFSFKLALSFHSLACLRGGGCYGYGYPYRYLSHTLFSTFVYLCLPSDFSPFTIIKYLLPCYFAIEQGPMYLVNLKDKFSQ